MCVWKWERTQSLVTNGHQMRSGFVVCHFETLGVNRGAMNTIISHNASHLRNLRNNLLQSFPGSFLETVCVSHHCADMSMHVACLYLYFPMEPFRVLSHSLGLPLS